MWWNSGPHLQRRMHTESSKSRQSSGFFCKGSDVEECLEVLRAKFGSVTRAWRVGLDTDESGQLDFREFCAGLKSLGFTGNIRTLWYNIDKDGSGTITLKELDPVAATMLEKFRALSTAKYGSIPNMWSTLLDQDRSGTVSHAEFAENVQQLGYTDPDEIWELFSLLLLRPGCRYITLPDIIFLQNWDEAKREQVYRKRLTTSWINRDPYLYGRPVIPGSCNSDDYENMVAVDMEKTKDDFRNFLIQRYGSLPQAFDAMDANSSGSLSLVEFQSLVSSVLGYCRMADARRLFIMFRGQPGGLLTWGELGISASEWVGHRLRVRAEMHQQKVQALANATARLGASPRQLDAVTHHVSRLKEAKPRADIAFWMPLPQGWGFPPDFDPAASRQPAWTAR